MLFQTRFTVKPTTKHPGCFPIDMLRFDSCWPADESDSNYIIAAYEGREVPHPIKLVHWSTAQAWTPHEKRWKSFDWVVVDVEQVQ